MGGSVGRSTTRSLLSLCQDVPPLKKIFCGGGASVKIGWSLCIPETNGKTLGIKNVQLVSRTLS